MMNKLRIALATLLLSFSTAVFPNITLTWTPPIQDTNGEVLALEDIQGYVIRVYKDDVQLPDIQITDGQVTGYVIITGKGKYRISMATNASNILGPFSDEIEINDGCVTYNRSAYNRRTSMKLCGD